VIGWIRPLIKGYHRAEVRWPESFPQGGALVVANHSGGLFPMDVPVFATGFYEMFGYDRPVYTLSHDMLFNGPQGEFLIRTGFIRANHENADEALRSGGVVVVFPGGDYDVYRPTLAENTIDFDGRTGYVRAALNAGVPIVPAVAIGGQETQLYLSRGQGLARALRLDKLMRVKILPISVGFPFGLSAVVPVNVPLPAKIVMQVLEPIDVVAEFGSEPDIDAVDAHVRRAERARIRRACGLLGPWHARPHLSQYLAALEALPRHHSHSQRLFSQLAARGAPHPHGRQRRPAHGEGGSGRRKARPACRPRRRLAHGAFHVEIDSRFLYVHRMRALFGQLSGNQDGQGPQPQAFHPGPA
jgi:1-acyl-sn-glycerol-3-phosphate acyltransferase